MSAFVSYRGRGRRLVDTPTIARRNGILTEGRRSHLPVWTPALRGPFPSATIDVPFPGVSPLLGARARAAQRCPASNPPALVRRHEGEGRAFRPPCFRDDGIRRHPRRPVPGHGRARRLRAHPRPLSPPHSERQRRERKLLMCRCPWTRLISGPPPPAINGLMR